MSADALVRPMRAGDLPAVERLIGWRQGTAHVLRHDPAGCWVAQQADGGVVGASVALRRDLTWILAAFAVRPEVQEGGVARQLLEAALAHSRGCLRGMLATSADPNAARRFRQAGFTLHPTMVLTGPVDRDQLPVVERVREGTAGDVDLMNSVDRQVRDCAHGVDHELLTSVYRLLVVDRSTGSGYAYLEPDGGPYLLAATNRRTAGDLLWESLAASTPGRSCSVGGVTPANEWALDVGLAAGLDVSTGGYLGLRHMRPPTPYLPSDHFL